MHSSKTTHALKPDTPTDEALIVAIEARKASLSPEHKARLAAVVTVQGTRAGIGHTVKSVSFPPEQMIELLTALEDNFKNHPQHYTNLEHLPRLREGVTFAEVQACLENDPMLARQVYAMHQRGGRPDVWGRHGKSLLFFESLRNTTEASRNRVYGKVQADWLRNNKPHEPFNGSVEEQREDMGGVGVASELMLLEMQKLGAFINAGWEWAYSDDINDDSPAGHARYLGNFVTMPLIYTGSARRHDWVGGWRAVAQGSEI